MWYFFSHIFPCDQSIAPQPTSDGIPYLEFPEQTMIDLQWLLRNYEATLTVDVRWYGGDGISYPVCADVSRSLVWTWTTTNPAIADTVNDKIDGATGTAVGAWNDLLTITPDLVRTIGTTSFKTYADPGTDGDHEIVGFDLTVASSLIIGNGQLFHSTSPGVYSVPIIGGITVDAIVDEDGVNPAVFTDTATATISTDDITWPKALGAVSLEGVSVPSWRTAADNVTELGGLTITAITLTINVTEWHAPPAP